MEMAKKRESEVNKLRKDLELAILAHESAEQSLRKRHNETVNDLTDQLEYVSKQKNRAEKEKQSLIIEIDSLQVQVDSLAKAKSSADSKIDSLDASNRSLKGQVDDLTRQLNESNASRNRLTQENFDLQHQVQELDSANQGLAKAKSQLQAQLDDMKRSHDDESRVGLGVFFIHDEYVLYWNGSEM